MIQGCLSNPHCLSLIVAEAEGQDVCGGGTNISRYGGGAEGKGCCQKKGNIYQLVGSTSFSMSLGQNIYSEGYGQS